MPQLAVFFGDDVGYAGFKLPLTLNDFYSFTSQIVACKFDTALVDFCSLAHDLTSKSFGSLPGGSPARYRELRPSTVHWTVDPFGEPDDMRGAWVHRWCKGGKAKLGGLWSFDTKVFAALAAPVIPSNVAWHWLAVASPLEVKGKVRQSVAV